MRWMLGLTAMTMVACGGDPTLSVGAPDDFFGGDPPSGSTSSSSEAGSSTGRASSSGGGGSTSGSGGLTSGAGGGGSQASDGVAVHLEKTFAGAGTVSFGVPLPPGAVADAKQIQVLAGGAPLEASVTEILGEHGPTGARTGVRSVLVQLPAAAMTGDTLDVEVRWGEEPSGPAAAAPVPFGSEEVSAASPFQVDTTVRTISASGGGFALTEGAHQPKTLFTGREPRVLATFPEGYVARTRILGTQATAAEAAAPSRAGMTYLSDALVAYGKSAMYDESYALNPDGESVIDPIADYSGWLYDRCVTFLTAYTHTGDAAFLRHAYRSCSHFASQITLSGPNTGIFSGKPEADTKYSHLRGLYAYYALTGDEGALAAGTAIAEMWESEPLFVQPYREGHTRGIDKLWTERLLATSLEGLYYGHRLTGETKYLTAFGEVLATAHLHITGDAAALATINPGVPFPPQGCFIHSGEQHADAGPDDPWCSPWMSELMLDPLLEYQAQTDDPRVDDILIRLGRFLRDVGTSYFDSDPVDDTFLAPSICDDPSAGENRRRLIPLYGAALGTDMKRKNFGEWSDMEHCADATALSAAAIRSLKRKGLYDQGPIGPFASEGASMLALHHELSSCAKRVFEEQTRPNRDPASWTSAELAAGAADPAKFIADNRIGYPSHVISPQRKISWWLNTSMLQYGLLHDAGVDVPALSTGTIQPAGCP